MIFGSRCAGCRARGPALCRTCRFALLGRPAAPAPDDVLVATAYTGRVRAVLTGFKYENRRPVAAHLAGILANRIEESARRAPGTLDIDLVTWAPTSPGRRRRRGFDQAELIARGVAARLGVPCRGLLERRGGPSQTGRSRAERLHGPRFAAHAGAAGRRILVVDDVVTTGATLHAAAAALRAGGASSVVRAAVAATPAALRSVELVA